MCWCTSVSGRVANERRRGKNDLIDAALAARRVVTGEGLSLPRGGGRREQLRLLLVERRGAVRARTAALNQFSALVVTAPDPLRHRLAALSKHQLARKAALLRSGSGAAGDVLRRIARRVERLFEEITEIDRDLSILVTEIAPHLLDEASFAVLAGTTPVDASSGKQQPRRRSPTQLGALVVGRGLGVVVDAL